MRQIILIEQKTVNFAGLGPKKIKLIYWCLPDSESSRSYKSTDLRLTITTGKVSTTEVYYFGGKVKALPKNQKTFKAKFTGAIESLEKRVYRPAIGPGFIDEVYSHYLKEFQCIGEIISLNHGHRHYAGLIRTTFGEFHFYDCNSEPETIAKLERGSKVQFKVSKDPYLLNTCGVTDLKAI